jgi:hypothetical protein
MDEGAEISPKQCISEQSAEITRGEQIGRSGESDLAPQFRRNFLSNVLDR